MGEQLVPSDGGEPPRRKPVWVAALLAVAVLGSVAVAGWAALYALGLPVNPWGPPRCGADDLTKLTSAMDRLKGDLPGLRVRDYHVGDCFFDSDVYAIWTYPTVDALTADAATAGCFRGNPGFQADAPFLTCMVAEERLELQLSDYGGVEATGIVQIG